MRAQVNVGKSAIGLFSLLAVVSCADPFLTSGAPGELGNGTFWALCDDGAVCDSNERFYAEFPKRIAEDSTLRVRFVPNSKQANAAPVASHVLVAGASLRQEGDGGLRGKVAGWGTIMAKATSGTLLDYLSLQVVTPSKILIYSQDGRDAVTAFRTPMAVEKASLGTHETLTLGAAPATANELLGGSPDVEWSVEPPDVATIVSRGPKHVAVRGEKAGQARLIAVAGRIRAEVVLDVTGASSSAPFGGSL